METRPPILMERMITALIPPDAREAVAGDLFELYISPSQYFREALCTIPWALASQARRVNLPVIALQCTLFYICLGGFGAPLRVALLSVVVFAALVLRDIYCGDARPSAHRTALAVIAVATSMLLLSQMAVFDLMTTHGISQDWFRWARFICFSPLVFPALCMLRLAVWRDHNWDLVAADRSITADALAAAYGAFVRRSARRTFTEGILLIAVLTSLAMLAADPVSFAFLLVPGVAWLGWAGRGNLLIAQFLALMALAAAFLTLGSQVRMPAREDNFVALCAHYQQELERQGQIRRLMSWLWAVPLFGLVDKLLIASGVADAQPLIIVIGLGLGQVIAFILSACNCEHSARIRDRMNHIASLTEKPVTT